MNKKLNLFLMFILCISLVLGGCGNKQESKPAESVEDNVQSQAVETEGGERTIVDHSGNEVVIPHVDEIKRVVVASPPLLSIYVNAIGDTDKLVGINPTSIKLSNPQVLDEMIPNWKEIDTTFLTGNTPNVEELLNLKPDIILILKNHNKGLENVKIPIVEFQVTSFDNEEYTLAMDKLMREVFDVKDDNSLQDEWDKANEKVDSVLKQVESESKQKGLVIMNNTGDKITVRGFKSFGDAWLVKSGLINTASELEGHVEVTMEQIYDWNPDIVYIFNGLAASDYINNNIEGQDWSKIEAFKSGRFYDYPKGMMGWGAPSSDSPLTLQWMVSKNFPDKLSEEEFKIEMKDYYSRLYDIDLTDDLMDSILNPNAEK